MAASPKLAIVAALEREVRPLVRTWERVEREHEGRRFRFFESESAVVVCGGIGAEAARRATEAVIALYHSSAVESVGFAGALVSSLKVGDVFVPGCVIDSSDGSRVETGAGGTLLSFSDVASAGQKSKLARAYGAQAVDMEAAAVARGAEAHGIGFRAVKAISDQSDFTMPELRPFVEADGSFRTGGFVAFIAIRPWMWLKVIRLARNTSRAARALCERLRQENLPGGSSETIRLQAVASRDQ